MDDFVKPAYGHEVSFMVKVLIRRCKKMGDKDKSLYPFYISTLKLIKDKNKLGCKKCSASLQFKNERWCCEPNNI